MSSLPCLVRSMSAAGETRYALGDPFVDRYRSAIKSSEPSQWPWAGRHFPQTTHTQMTAVTDPMINRIAVVGSLARYGTLSGSSHLFAASSVA
jgi:hypothetical protein